MCRTPNHTESKCLALSAREVAKLLNVSQRHVWALNASGRMPRPVHLGRAVRWNRSELEAWLDSGCPARDAWELLKASQS